MCPRMYLRPFTEIKLSSLLLFLSPPDFHAFLSWLWLSPLLFHSLYSTFPPFFHPACSPTLIFSALSFFHLSFILFIFALPSFNKRGEGRAGTFMAVVYVPFVMWCPWRCHMLNNPEWGQEGTMTLSIPLHCPPALYLAPT